MTWVLLSLMYSFSTQSAKIAATLPPPATMTTLSTIAQSPDGSRTVSDVEFSLNINGVFYKWDTIGLFMLPGESRSFKVSSSDREGGFDWSASGGAFSGTGERERRFTAPADPGLYRVKISRGSHTKRINVLVMIPFRRQTTLNGYPIGGYASRSHFTKLSLPQGFIEVTQANMNAWISPHFRLKEFACSVPAGFPKYVVLRERLIRKLEALIDRVRRAGVRCNDLTVISGYRTPSFNSANGNVENSVHTYGGAADIVVDADGDGAMDDLNHDGKRDVADAIALYNIVDLLEKEQPEFQGGDGYYASGGPHGAFVHTDIRGERSRWHN